MDQLDDIVKSAMQALEATTPRGYFDELASQIEARLEGSMQTESDSSASKSGPGILATNRGVVDGADEDSGVHDIKALAKTAKQRVSRRITTQNDVVSDVLSASHSGLHAIALPDPAKMVSLPSVEEARAMASSSSMRVDDIAVARGAASTATAHEPKAASRGVPVWLWAGGGVAAAAAAVFAFINFGGGDRRHAEPRADSNRAPSAAAEPSKAAAPAREEAITSGTVAPGEMPLDGSGMGAGSGSAMIATDSAEADKEAAGDTGAEAKKKDRSDDRFKSDDDGGPSKGKSSGGDGKSDKAGGGTGKGDKVKSDKTDVKPDPKTKGDGSVLGDGDKDELGIGDALTGGGGKVEKPSKTELTSRELRDGLGAVAGKAKACYGSHGVAGTVKVKLTVDPSGKVSKASATGDFSGTPTGNCVVSALKAASFPAWDGAPMSTTYAVLLSD